MTRKKKSKTAPVIGLFPHELSLARAVGLYASSACPVEDIKAAAAEAVTMFEDTARERDDLQNQIDALASEREELLSRVTELEEESEKLESFIRAKNPDLWKLWQCWSPK